jgi:hypothetical protein
LQPRFWYETCHTVTRHLPASVKHFQTLSRLDFGLKPAARVFWDRNDYVASGFERTAPVGSRLDPEHPANAAIVELKHSAIRCAELSRRIVRSGTRNL